jgi:uncharacterized iron-regulated membrane protein
MTACFTGAILVFEKELQQAIYPDRYFSKAIKEVQVPIEKVLENLRISSPGLNINSIKLFSDPRRNIEVSVTQKTIGDDIKKKRAEGAKTTAFIDPYSGALVELYSYGDSYFYTVMSLHRWLLAGDIGKLIMGISMLMFLFILITGLILWWPKTKLILKQRSSISWKAGWKRLTRDLHYTLGIYTVLFLFIFAFTSLVWSFQWFNDGIYTMTNSSKDPIKPPPSIISKDGITTSVDNILADAFLRNPQAIFYSVTWPKDSSGVFAVNILNRGAAHDNASDHHYYNQYSGQYLKKVSFADRPLGQRVRATVKPIHVSSIFGLPSKILGFIVCLFGATFPITGVIMWLSRLKKI